MFLHLVAPSSFRVLSTDGHWQVDRPARVKRKQRKSRTGDFIFKKINTSEVLGTTLLLSYL